MFESKFTCMHSFRSRTGQCRERKRERERWIQGGRERERMPECCARVYVCMLGEKLNEITSVELQVEQRVEE